MTRVKLVLVALAALVLLAIPAPAPAQGGLSVSTVLFGFPAGGKLISETSIPIQVTGQLTIDFHGSAAAGCAGFGLCAYSGTIVVSPRSGQLAIQKYRVRGRIRELAFLVFTPAISGYTTVADVQRSVSGQPSGLCADAQTSFFGPTSTLTARGGSLRIALLQAGGSLLSTRCAGPLDGDLASVSPQATISLGAARRGETSIDLGASTPFASHGFAGTLDSTLALKLGRPQSSPLRAMFPPGIKTERVRTVIEHLRVVRVGGHLSAAVQGAADPIVCGLLDSCGLTGSLSLALGPRDGSGELIATGPASRPYGDFLAALGLSRTGHRQGIVVAGDVRLSPAATVTAAFSQSGASCVDTAATGALAIALEPRGNVLAGSGTAANSWRTRCPGPMMGGQSPVLSLLPAPRGELGHKTFTVHLRAGGPLVDDGYSISPEGDLAVTIARGRLTQTVSTQPTG